MELLAKIIPLDIAATLSPGILAIALLLLGNKKNPKTKTLVFLLGSLIIGIGITILGVVLAQIASPDQKPTLVSAIIDLVAGLAFIIFGIKVLITKEKKVDKSKTHELSLWKIFLIGVVITVTNTDADLFNFIAAKETVSAPDIDIFWKVVFLIMNLSFFVLAITLPLFFYLLFPKLAAKPLAKLNILAMKYSRFIMFVLFAIFGIYFAYRGIMFFIK
jgi:threonine/homoserine/homoserine lactone efflux protein